MKRAYLVAAFLLLYAFFLITLNPSAPIGDSPELTANAALLGIAHPPGYAAFIMLGKAFQTLIPFGNLAFRNNFSSAVLGAVNGILVYLLALELLVVVRPTIGAGRYGAAFLAAIFGCGSISCWNQAVVSEVYMLNAFFILSATFCAVRFLRGRNGMRQLMLMTFICGLGTANHHTMLMLSPVFFCVALWGLFRKRFSGGESDDIPLRPIIGLRFIGLLATLALLGMSANLYLPIRADKDPRTNWGDPDTAAKFRKHIARGYYGANKKGRLELNPTLKRFQLFLRSSAAQWPGGVVLFFFMLYGVYRLVRSRDRPVKLLILSLWAFLVFGFLFLLNFKITPLDLFLVDAFYPPAYLLQGIFLACGLYDLAACAARKFPPRSKLYNYWHVIPLLVGFCVMFGNLRLCDASNYYFTFDYSCDLLDNFPSNSQAFVSEDTHAFTLTYVNTVERRRDDVTIYDVTGSMFSHNPFTHFKHFEYRYEYLENTRMIMNGLVGDAPSRSFFTWRNSQQFRSDGLAWRPKELAREAMVDLQDRWRRPLRIDYEDQLPSFRRMHGKIFASAGRGPICQDALDVPGRVSALKNDPLTRELLAIIHLNRANFLWWTDPDRALAELDTAAILGYDLPEINLSMTEWAFRRRDYKKAADLAWRTVDISPTNVPAYKRALVILAEIYKYQGNSLKQSEVKSMVEEVNRYHGWKK